MAVHSSFTRRQVVRGSIGLLAAGKAVLPSAVLAQPARQGGHFRLATDGGNLNDNLDPALTNGSHIQQLNYLIRNWLTERDDTGEIVPSLAESLTGADGATRWSVRLRSGVVFHNGKPLTAEDVRASLLHHMGDDTRSAAKPLLEAVRDIEVVGELDLEIHLSTGNADLPALLNDYHLVICPLAEDGTLDYASGIGTGPYRLVSFEPGVASEHVKFEEYWVEDRPNFDRITLIAMNDTNARMSAIMTGEVDASTRVDPQFADQLASRDGVEIIEGSPGSHITFAMWTDTPPFDNNDVRTALKLSIDREALINAILRGHGTLGNDHPISENYAEWADLDQRRYDPDRARELLRGAGYDELEVELHVSDAGNVGTVDAAVLWQQQALLAGIRLNLIREPEDGYWSNVWLNRPFVAGAWGERPSAQVMLTTAYAADAPWNETHWRNERFNTLLAQAKTELDNDRRQQMFAEMQQLIRDRGGAIIPFFNNRLSARRSNVEIAETANANYAGPGGMLALDRWFFGE